jgi:hypothetical protein
MRTLLFILCICFWSLIFTVIDAWSLPQRSNRSVKTMTRAIPIEFNVVDNLHASYREVRRMQNAAVAYLRDNDVRANGRRIRRLPDMFKSERLSAKDEGLFFAEFSHWWNFINQRGWRKPFTINSIAAPPWTINGVRFMAGFAMLNSYNENGGYAYSNVHMFNSSGRSRYRHSVVGIIHEALHTIGCGHEAGRNIMHEAAFAEQEAIEGTGLLLPIGPRCRVVIERLKTHPQTGGPLIGVPR